MSRESERIERKRMEMAALHRRVAATREYDRVRNYAFFECASWVVRAPVQTQGVALSEKELFNAWVGELHPGVFLTPWYGWQARAALAQAQQSEDTLNAKRYCHLRDNIRDLHKAVFRGATPLMGVRTRLPLAGEIDDAIDASIAALPGSAT